ncbi:ERF family protein [Paraconexibacter algicola]|uniref:ERF superfamily protein n=1 Tax=Paraconexibacter algicola TaxID=2133960 RepID=A0A2T4UEC8_9ACTN|nr:ERF family protein [Paraconexibacter algicola]PTL55772.1 hypothetical protein C7Y72_19275 [Paraconexibacter algicola]
MPDQTVTDHDAEPAAPAPALDPTSALIAALADAQGAFPPIPKTQTATVPTKNGGSYQYTYADLGDVLAAVRPVLSERGLALVQYTIREDARTVLVTELRHPAGGVLRSEVDLGQSSANPQAFGGALTYLRRYEVVTLLGIAAEEDRDAQDVTPASDRRPATPELPAWARDATRDRKTDLGTAMSLLVDRAVARELVVELREQIGLVPDVLVEFMIRLAAAVSEHADDPTPAEAADAWAADATDDELVRVATGGPGEKPERVDAARAEIHARRAHDSVPDHAVTPDEDDAEPSEQPERPAEPEAAEPAAGQGALDVGDRPPAGTVPVPPLDGRPTVDLAALRTAGCICDSPLQAQTDEHARDSECPLVGHGVRA